MNFIYKVITIVPPFVLHYSSACSKVAAASNILRTVLARSKYSSPFLISDLRNSCASTISSPSFLLLSESC
jgi:hypothetical protein